MPSQNVPDLVEFCKNPDFEPSVDELAGMLNYLWERIKPRELLAILAIKPPLAAEIRQARRPVSTHVKRLIWFLYCLDRHPNFVFDKRFVMTWGRNETDLPKYSNLDEHAKAQALCDYIRRLHLRSRRMSVEDIATVCQVPVNMVLRAADMLGYQARFKNLNGFATPHNRWLNVDWRKDVREIAASFNVHPNTVTLARRRIQQMELEVAARLMLETGHPLNWFYPIYGPVEAEKLLEIAKRVVAESAPAEVEPKPKPKKKRKKSIDKVDNVVVPCAHEQNDQASAHSGNLLQPPELGVSETGAGAGTPDGVACEQGAGSLA